MKLYLSLISMLIVGWNTYAADIYVNNSGQAGTYTTISAAITAAVAGDKIYVSPYGVYTENLAIAKSLTIVSAVPNTRFSVVGNVTITSAPTQEVIIIGGEFSGDIVANTGTATLASKGNFILSDSKCPNVYAGNFVSSKILFSEMTDVGILHGKIIGCLISSIYINDGPNTSLNDTIFIIGNKVTFQIQWNNNDCYFLIANNYVKSSNPGIVLYDFQYNVNKKNNIINNSIINTQTGSGGAGSYGQCLILQGLSGSNLSNIDVTGNYMKALSTGNASIPYISCGMSTCYSNYLGRAKLYYNYIKSSNGAVADNVVGNVISATVFNHDELGKVTDALVVNQGSPALQYYDIDLTRNDIGTFGGPYSIDNYWNTATGRARVYDLNMPFEIWNGSTPSIKAEGTHIK